jgi:putative transposase
LTVSRAWYYERPKSVAKRKTRRDELAGEIEVALGQKEASGYGYRRVTKTLARQGRKVAAKVVLEVMRTRGWLCRRKRKPIGITKSLAGTKAENLLKKLVAVAGLQRPDQAWVGDITLIEYGTQRQKKCYLATLLDGFSRRVVGWQLSPNCDGQLTLGALQKALQNRQPPPGLIHHTDRGSQYTSGEYTTALAQAKATRSLAGKAKPWENGMAESFNGTLKTEEVWRMEYETYAQVEENLQEWLELYDQKRLHSSLGYLPPAEFETVWLAANTN